MKNVKLSTKQGMYWFHNDIRFFLVYELTFSGKHHGWFLVTNWT